ncbi:MAG TPA: hypothetical protein VM865_03330 [Acidobacteriaceae bacterium]|nr:hypothetical protein [Acidobacteriaceae bacterium]
MLADLISDYTPRGSNASADNGADRTACHGADRSASGGRSADDLSLGVVVMVMAFDLSLSVLMRLLRE